MLIEIKVEACVGHNLLKVDFALAPVLRVLTGVFYPGYND